MITNPMAALFNDDWTVFVAPDHIMTAMRREVGDFFIFCSCGDNWTLDGRYCADHLAEACRAHVVAKSAEALLKAHPAALANLVRAGDLVEEIAATAAAGTPNSQRAKQALELIESVLKKVEKLVPRIEG